MELTKREQEICAELIKGKSNAEIAEKLFLSVHTVKGHISSLINRLCVKNRTELAYKLGQENIINL